MPSRAVFCLVRQRTDQIDVFADEMSCLTIVWATIGGKQLPWSTRNPCSLACRFPSAASRDFPIPASSLKRSTCPCPCLT